eukprot:4257196-Pyramimonas_sp.AAC.1
MFGSWGTPRTAPGPPTETLRDEAPGWGQRSRPPGVQVAEKIAGHGVGHQALDWGARRGKRRSSRMDRGIS